MTNTFNNTEISPIPQPEQPSKNELLRFNGAVKGGFLRLRYGNEFRCQTFFRDFSTDNDGGGEAEGFPAALSISQLGSNSVLYVDALEAGESTVLIDGFVEIE